MIHAFFSLPASFLAGSKGFWRGSALPVGWTPLGSAESSFLLLIDDDLMSI